MLHTAAVPVDLLTVLTELQEKTSAADFALAGDTSLALRLGKNQKTRRSRSETLRLDNPSENLTLLPE